MAQLNYEYIFVTLVMINILMFVISVKWIIIVVTLK